QEKCDSMSSSFQEPFLDTSDPTVTEVEEVPAGEEQEEVPTRRKPSRELPEDRERAGSPQPVSILAPQLVSDYKPQVSNGNLLGYVAADLYRAQPPAAPPEPETSVFFRDYTSPLAPLWEGEAGGHHVGLLEKINLILNSSQSGQGPTLGSAWGAHGALLGNPWGPGPGSDGQEQTLVSEELLSCLRAMNGVVVEGQPCFPHSIRGLF
ncbi:hypothetical protein M959_05746, partial [Chaetura pelagica]